MCIAVPMRLIEILPEKKGKVELDGVERTVSLRLVPDCRIGDYVLIHAGFAIETVSKDAAEENLRILDELKRSLEK